MQFTDCIDPSAALRVVFRNHQCLLGDRLAMTSFVRDVKATYPHWQIFVDVEKSDVWRHNPHLAGLLLPGDPEPEKIDLAWNVGPSKATQGSKANGVHLIRAFAYGWTRMTGLPVKDGPWRPDLHLSPEELEYRPVAGDYWVFNPDTNNMGSKRWPVESWRELILALPQVRFVQVGLAKDCSADFGDEPNVTSLVGRTTERQLFALVRRAAGCVGLLSSLVHIAAALQRPCVVLAGGREPDTFAHYPGHYYLSRVGLLDCCRDLACWKNSIGACRDQVESPAGPVSRCMTLIGPADVARGIELYSERRKRDLIDRIDPTDNEVNAVTQVNQVPNSSLLPASPRLLRIVTNGKMLGGAERSVVSIARMFRAKEWQVELATRQPLCDAFRRAIEGLAIETDRVSSPCDCLLWYASDQVYDAHLPEFDPLRAASRNARRKVMALTYKLGKVPSLDWCRDWDRYLFLSSAMAEALAHKSHRSYPSQILAPAVDLEPFLAVRPDYAAPLRIVRHSSQGDNKWPLHTQDLIDACPQAKFAFMPAPSRLRGGPRVAVNPVNTVPVSQFLSQGNLFLYLLPEGYTDQGPRVIVEAMAAGLPVLCERRDGAADRVTDDTGWFVQSWQEAAAIINTVSPDLLAAKGQAARERARTVFDPWNWYRAISGETA